MGDEECADDREREWDMVICMKCGCDGSDISDQEKKSESEDDSGK